MTGTKYAVVIVTYNRESLLRECVDNVERQTVLPDSIIIVNNASTDNTSNYLEELNKKGGQFDIISLPHNIGGAGGFAKGIERALHKNVDCILIIDDDAMIAIDYMEQILRARQHNTQYKAFAGTLKTDGKIDTFHRRNLQRTGLMSKNCKEQEYRQPCFVCDIVSFCGMVLDMELVRRIGLPHAEYFIWYDDTEYSLRICQHSKFLIVTTAEINHRTTIAATAKPRRYDWKDYYAVRNRLLMVREHGNLADRIVNFADLFAHVLFRNWLFSMIKLDHYDWKYERKLVRAAIRNARGGKLENIIIKRERLE